MTNLEVKEGVLFFNKPVNESSYYQIKKLKKMIPKVKIGHCGTLDPFAEGLLIILLGRAVKLQNHFLNLNKVYETIFKFGVETDTLDFTGKVIAKSNSKVTLDERALIELMRERFLGEIDQVPPSYSAIKIKGKKAYNLARQGKKVDLLSRKIKIDDIEIKKWDLEKQELILKITCGAGTYVRSLARDLGHALNNFATTLQLKRVQVGEFTLKKAVTAREIQESGGSLLLKNRVSSLKELIPHNAITVNREGKEVNYLKNGNFSFFKNEMKLGYNFFFQGETLKAVSLQSHQKTKIIFNGFNDDV